MKKNSILFKYLISYLLVLFIPLFILSAIIKYYFIKTYSESVLKQKAMQIQQIKSSIDIQLNQLHNFAIQSSSKNIFSRYNIENNPSSFNDIMKEIRYFIHINANLQEVIFHLKDSDIYYMSSGTSKNDYIFTNIMNYEEISKDNSLAFFSNLDAPIWLKAQTVYNRSISNENIITYIVPCIMNESVIIYQITTSFFNRLFAENEDNIESSVLLLGMDNRLIYAYNTDKDFLNNLETIIAVDTGVMKEVAVAGNDYYIYKTVSDLKSFVLMEIIPKSFIEEHVNKFSQIYHVGLIVIGLLGMLVIYWQTIANYNPIKKLGNTARAANLKIPEHLNALESIEFAIENLSKNSSKIPERDVEAMRELKLFHLLRGQYKSVDEFNNDCKGLDMFVLGNRFRVVVLLTEFNSEYALPEPQIFDQLRDMMRIDYEVFMLEYLEQFSYIFILSREEHSSIEHSDGEYSKNELEKRLRFLQMHYKEITGSSLTIGIGYEYNNTGDILLSYNEAKNAVNYKLVRGADSIIFHNDIHRNISPIHYAYPKAELDSLYYAIINGNTTKIEFITEILISLLRKEYHSLFLAKCLCYDVINTALRAVHDINLSISFFDKYNKSEFTSIDEFIQVVEMICSEIIECMDGNKKKYASLDINAVTAYINENYSDPNFCVSSLADHFNMSISNFSHQFKSYMSQNISAYINNIRIKTAKTLLASTELSVSDIALQVGYIHSSSFVRKFKQAVGI
ncbi:MAG TPA: AraC family transcriptional regulator, partial [Clostridiales bacterium]|nr:AraC family transcriptional regulator [Clostridiales bacterium]